MALAYWNQRYPFETMAQSSGPRSYELGVVSLGLGITVALLVGALHGYAGQRWFGSDANAKSVAWDTGKASAIITGGLVLVALAGAGGRSGG